MHPAPLNILYLANRVPYPPDKGDRIRTYHQVRRLAERHNVYVACFHERPDDLAHINRLREQCREVATVRWRPISAARRALTAVAAGRPSTIAAFQAPALLRTIDAWCRRVSFDLVIAFASNMAAYALHVPARRRVLDLCDVDSEKWRAYGARRTGPIGALLRREARSLRQFELELIRQFDAVLFITDRERRLLDPGATNPRLHVVTNGCSLPSPAPPPPARCEPVIGFLGSMDYPPNVDAVRWFCDGAWPEVRGRVPSARFVIVGRNPVRAVTRLARHPGVQVVGAVPNPGPYLATMRAFAAPLHVVRGLPNKVLEAMAFGRPVVATCDVGHALMAQSGVDLLTSDNAAGFARHLVALCEDNRLCDRIGSAGSLFVGTHHHWPAVLADFERIVNVPRPAHTAEPGIPVNRVGGLPLRSLGLSAVSVPDHNHDRRVIDKDGSQPHVAPCNPAHGGRIQ